MCTASNAYKVKALAANPKVALTIDTDAQPYRTLLVRGTGECGDRRRRALRVPGSVQEEP